MRIRIDKDANYKAIFFNGKTIRSRLDLSKPILAPLYAEIEDVAINSLCYANCSYCYTSATKKGTNFEDIVEKAKNVWGSVKLNNRPFQIAIGGAGESTLHPDWIPFVKAVRDLDIIPNYTTNGMHLSHDILRATEAYCGGVALSYHPHLRKYYDNALYSLRATKTKLNTHIIIGDKKSLIDLQAIYETYKDVIEYFVVLPYQAVGRGKQIDTEETWDATFKWIAQLPIERQKQFAFGALFYPYLIKNVVNLDIDIYEPELYSGYRIFDDSYLSLRKSSYDLTFK